MYERLKQICKEKGTTVTELCAQATGSSGNLATWKKGYMRSDYLLNCARILGVSTDYILGIEKEREEEKMKVENKFYEITKNALEKWGTNYDEILTTLGLDVSLNLFYENGFYPSDEVVNKIAFVTNHTTKYLLSLFEDTNMQLSKEFECLLTAFNTLDEDKKYSVIYLTSVAKNRDGSEMMLLADLDEQGILMAKRYRETTAEGRAKMIKSVTEIYEEIYKKSTGESEDVAN